MIKNRILWPLVTVLLLSIAAAAQTPEAIRSNAKAAYDAGRYPEAVELYKQYVALRPADASGQLDLGSACYSAKSYPEAVTALRAALKLAPSLRLAQRLLAAALYANGQYAEAVDAY